MNYSVTLWIVENETDKSSLLLYGFAVPVSKAVNGWKKADIKFKESEPTGKKRLNAYRLTSTLDPRDLQSLKEDFKNNHVDLSSDRSDPFSLFGKWIYRGAVEIPDEELNPLPVKLTNITGYGANRRSSLWSISKDPLGDYLSHISAIPKTIQKIRNETSYDEILELISDETGLRFKSDDFACFGNLDFFENMLGADLDVVGFKVATIKKSDESSKSVDLLGIEIEVFKPLTSYKMLVFKIDLNGQLDRVHSEVKIFNMGDPTKFQVTPRSDSFFSSYKVEVFDGVSGDFLSKESNYLITELHMNMSLISQSKNVSTDWSRRQLKARPNLDPKSVEHTTTTSNGPATVVGSAPKEEPWRMAASKASALKNLYRHSEYDFLIPNIDNITDFDRVKPILDLANKGRYQSLDIFDPYFDSFSIEKLLIRISSHSMEINIYSSDEADSKHFSDLLKGLSNVRAWLPCIVRVFSVGVNFHDRFIFGTSADSLDAFALTNSLDGYNKSYPMWVIPMFGRNGVQAIQYADKLKSSASQRWDSSEENKKSRDQDRKAYSSTDIIARLSTFEEFQVAQKANMVKGGQKIAEEHYSTYLNTLHSINSAFSYGSLAEFAYSGIVDGSKFGIQLDKWWKTRNEEVVRIQEAIRGLQADCKEDLHYIGFKQMFDGYIENRNSNKVDLAKSYREIGAAFDHSPRMYKMDNRHRIFLWKWLTKHDFAKAYDLYCETKDTVFIEALANYLIFDKNVLSSILKQSFLNQGDRLLFTMALIVVTHFPPNGGVPQSRKALDHIEAWRSSHAELITDLLATFSYVVAFGERDNDDSDLENLLEKICESWKKEPPNKADFDSINILIRGGLIDMRDKRVYLFAKRLEAVDEQWSQLIYERVLSRLERLLKKEGQSFHFFHAEDNGLLDACRKILESWSEENRTSWFENALPRKIRYLPNRPFMAKKSYETYSAAVNQYGLWLIMKLSFAKQTEDVSEILENIDQHLLPGAYQHQDFFNILKTLLGHVKDLKNDLEVDQLEILDKWDDQVTLRECSWWPNQKKS